MDSPLWRTGTTVAAFDPTPLGINAEVWSITRNVDSVYWATGLTNNIFRIKRDPFAWVPDPFCSVETFSTTSGRPFGLAADSADVYWVELDSNLVGKKAQSGGLNHVLATGLSHPFSIALTDRFIFWLDAPDNQPASIWKLAK